MTHNVYAVENPDRAEYEALYRVYVGDERNGVPVAGYQSAEVRFQFQVTPTRMLGDFDHSQSLDCHDLGLLISHFQDQIADNAFDLNGDGEIDSADVDTWLVEAGAAPNSPTGGVPFLPGDANLDGNVDFSDQGLWEQSRFTTNGTWCTADFNYDGNVDGSDFNIWNIHRKAAGSLS